jgi:ATP-dependent DNA helicase PIF1
VRTWPRPSAAPAEHDPAFNKWALSQLRLHKPFRDEAEFISPSIRDNFHSHLLNGGFPAFPPPTSYSNADYDSDDSQPDIDLASGVPPILEANLRQDDYQQVMGHTQTDMNDMSLLGFRELDLAHQWPTSWLGVPFNRLLSWLSQTKDCTTPPSPDLTAIDLNTLSIKQHQALNLVTDHVFGPSRHQQLLMVVLGTAGTGKSYLINAIRQTFSQRLELHSLRITAPTGIAASNISGSTIYSLLSLLNENLTGSRLNFLQNSLQHVRLIVIDEYSFMSISVFESLDRQLRKIFPNQADRPFGGINIVLCGDPAQLAPVRGQPVYAPQNCNTPRPNRFHLFQTVIELDQPFRQTGSDETQIRFRQLLSRVADCRAHEDDWVWLQTRHSTSLPSKDNATFDTKKHIVSTNNARNTINKKRLGELAPIINIAGYDDGLHDISEDNVDEDAVTQGGPQLYAIGAEVMLTANLWTEAGLVNGACGIVDDIVKPPDDRQARVIMVNFPNYHGPSLSPSRPSVVPITQVRAANKNGMPLTLAWAVTIHKSQGMTLDHVTVDLGNTEFASGLTFVALSQAKTFTGLRVTPFDFNRFKRIEKGRHVIARRHEFVRLRTLAATSSR